MNSDPGQEQRDQDIATLLRVAGRRQSAPDVRSARVREAVEAQWIAELRRARRRRRARVAIWLAAAASLLIGAIAAHQWLLGVPMPDRIAGLRVERIEGSVWLDAGPDGAQPSRELVEGEALPLRASLVTSEGGRIALRMPSGHSLRIDRASQLRLLGPARLALDRGAVYIDSAGDDPRQPSLSVETRFGEVRELGTQYELRLEQLSVRLRLREGAVRLIHGGELDEVRAGMEFELFADGRSSSAPISPDSPEWDWIAGVRPRFELEGRSAREFLDWISRERGLRLAFDEPSTEAAAQETLLKGATHRLSAEESLDAVLATCGMHYRVEDGALVVSAPPRGGAPAK